MRRQLEFPLRRPRLRSGVVHRVIDGTAHIRLGATECEIQFNAAAKKPLVGLLKSLRAGLDTQHIPRRFGDFAPNAWDVVRSLDRYGFLTDANPGRAAGYTTGKEFARRVETFAAQRRRELAFPFSVLLRDGKASRAQLIAYAREYYHVVLSGPKALMPALGHPCLATGGDDLYRLLTGEVGHDSYLEKALASVGVDVREVKASGPSAQTYALMATLAVLAAQDPLSLAAVLFLFEEPNPDFHQYLARECRRLKLPAPFAKNICAHAELNTDGNHGSITFELLKHFDVVTREESIVALKHVQSILEMLDRLETYLVAQ